MSGMQVKDWNVISLSCRIVIRGHSSCISAKEELFDSTRRKWHLKKDLLKKSNRRSSLSFAKWAAQFDWVRHASVNVNTRCLFLLFLSQIFYTLLIANSTPLPLRENHDGPQASCIMQRLWKECFLRAHGIAFGLKWNITWIWHFLISYTKLFVSKR